jgi:hypothetical protein
MSVQGMGISATPLAGYMLCLATRRNGLATTPVFLVHLAIMGTTVPASLLMARIGRRAGFFRGRRGGVLAGGIGTLALLRASFPLLASPRCCRACKRRSSGIFGSPRPTRRASVSTEGHLLGDGRWCARRRARPQTAKLAVDWLQPVPFAGIYLAMAGFSVAIGLLVQLIRIPRLSAAERAAGGRPMTLIARQPAYRVALAASVFGYAVMTLTMSATPLAMLACGFTFNDSATVIQAHIVGMFLPSFFTGPSHPALRRVADHCRGRAH